MIMLNKEEKRLIETYVIPLLDRVIKLSYEPDKEYGDEFIKSNTDGKEGLWVAFSKIWEDIFNAKKIIEGIIRKEYVESMTSEQKIMELNKKFQKEEKLKEVEEKNTKKLLKDHKKEVIAEFLKENRSNFQDIINKKAMESFKEGIQKSRMSDKEILNKAEIIKLNREIMKN